MLLPIRAVHCAFQGEICWDVCGEALLRQDDDQTSGWNVKNQEERGQILGVVEYLPWHLLFGHREAGHFTVRIVKLTGLDVKSVLFFQGTAEAGLVCRCQNCWKKYKRLQKNWKCATGELSQNETGRKFLTRWLGFLSCEASRFQTVHNPLQGFRWLDNLVRRGETCEHSQKN